MAASINAQTSASWNDVWRVVRYLLENTNCDYAYTTRDENSLQKIIQTIRTDAHAIGKTMPSDFIKVVEWLKHRGVDTDPIN